MNEIHLWLFEYDSAISYADRNCLDEREWERAKKFYTPELQTRFQIRRSLRKQLIGSYLKKNCGSIQISTTTLGKPFLPGSGVYFSTSSTANLFAIAITKENDLGMDIEAIDHVKQVGLSTTYLTEEEIMHCSSLSEKGKDVTLSSIWSIKEAIAKKIGHGLQLPFNQMNSLPALTDSNGWKNLSLSNHKELSVTFSKYNQYTYAIASDRPAQIVKFENDFSFTWNYSK